MRPSDYEPYCQTDPVFYDDPGRLGDTETLYPQARDPLPGGWSRSRDSVWVYLSPDGVTLPEQGWKVHVSSTPDEAPDVIGAVLGFCFREGVSVKFLRSREAVLNANSKYAPRGSSGKLVTIYPRDEDELRRVLHGLSPVLAGRRGPYILSDLRWHDGPLYVRYGAFRQMYCLDEQGRTVSALRDPAGRLVPDLRRPVFSVPSWTDVPEFLAEQVTARSAPRPEDFPYRIERALHFSNGGGVYKARDTRDGRTVVLREARPMAGLDRAGTDAVERLHRERDMLRRLDGLDFVPRLHEHVTVWEHEYLVEEFIEGEKLERHLFAGRHPLLGGEPEPAALAAYAAQALDFTDQLDRMITTLHKQGVAFGDLHPGNVIVRPDGRLALVDFELAFDLATGTPPAMGAPGFISPAARTGTSVDRYALACMRLFLFIPLSFLVELDSAKAGHLARAAEELFGLPDGFAAETVRALHEACGGRLPAGRTASTGTKGRALFVPDGASPDDWQRVMDELAGGILAAATPEREDRLYPGDPEQFAAQGAVNLLHGASGVLYALAETGYPVPDQHVEWLLRATGPAPDVRPGLYDGLHGVAFTLDRLGLPDLAREALERARTVTAKRRELGVLGHDLAGGLAGIGLGLLHFADRHGDGTLTDEAVAAGRALEQELVQDAAAYNSPEPGPRRSGLLHGGSGRALFLTRLYEHTGEDHWLDLASAALARDLQGAQVDDKGMLLAEDGRAAAYLGNGSAGAVVAARALLRHRPDDPELGRTLPLLERACTAQFLLMPGLFHGRAGLLWTLAQAAAEDDAAPGGPVTADRAGTGHAWAGEQRDRQLARLAWHLVRHQDRVAFPGHQLYRLSTDLATGSAGILLALHAALTRKGTPLPLLDHRGALPSAVSKNQR
ncbi:class III lanthionine synthetase LanKC [Streptomyces sp. URMC 127]|uniref:class III lanthionine synthetase LanKC n=1 Tax=Streptomyces sp. URMC 127 TaxID=3423402 RepID=UPI003F1A59CF